MKALALWIGGSVSHQHDRQRALNHFIRHCSVQRDCAAPMSISHKPRPELASSTSYNHRKKTPEHAHRFASFQNWISWKNELVLSNLNSSLGFYRYCHVPTSERTHSSRVSLDLYPQLMFCANGLHETLEVCGCVMLLRLNRSVCCLERGEPKNRLAIVSDQQ